MMCFWDYNPAMILLGVDFGTKRIGIAISEGSGWMARGLTTIVRKGGARDLAALADLASKHHVDAIVMGLALNMDGTEGRMARLARDFAGKLGSVHGLVVHFFDERLSSFEADQVMELAEVKRSRRKEIRDQVAAAVILEGWMKARSNESESES